MKIQAMTNSGITFLVDATLTRRAKFIAIDDEHDQLCLVETILADGSYLWVNPLDIRACNGEEYIDSVWEDINWITCNEDTGGPTDAATATGMYDHE